MPRKDFKGKVGTVCVIDGCDRLQWGYSETGPYAGMCKAHYLRLYTKGRIDTVKVDTSKNHCQPGRWCPGAQKLQHHLNYIKNREKYIALAAQRARDNPEKTREWQRIARAKPENKPKALANSIKYQLEKRRAVPKWVTSAEIEEMKNIYIERQRISEETGIPHEVDHIYPLRGKLVSGLHVPSNLQIIPMSENRKKSNKHSST